MMGKINLLSFKKAVSPQEKRVRLTLQIVSLAVLGIYAFVLSSFSSYWFFLKSKSDKLDKNLKEAKQQLAIYQEKESLYRKLIAKLQDLSDVVEFRPDFGKVFADLKNLEVEGVDFNTIRADKGGEVEFEGKAGETLFLDDLVLTLLAYEDYQGVTFSGVNRSEEGGVDFNLKGRRSLLP